MRKWIFGLVMLLGHTLSAQIKGIVVDETDKPVSYVTIWVENETTAQLLKKMANLH